MPADRGGLYRRTVDDMNDVERAADSYATFHDCSSYADTVSAFRAGARWQREQGNKVRHGICLSCNRTSLDLSSHVCEDPMSNRQQEEQST